MSPECNGKSRPTSRSKREKGAKIEWCAPRSRDSSDSPKNLKHYTLRTVSFTMPIKDYGLSNSSEKRAGCQYFHLFPFAPL